MDDLYCKILMVGPQGTGKTTLSNILADFSKTPADTYKPTVGVRILEFELEVQPEFLTTNTTASAAMGNVITSYDSGRAQVELWDCSGDKKYSNSFPAMLMNVDGVVVVYNIDKMEKDRDYDRQMERWYNYFVNQAKLSDKQVAVFVNSMSESGSGARPKMPKYVGKGVQVAYTSLSSPSDIDFCKSEFTNLVERVLDSKKAQRNAVEEDVMQSGF